MRLPSLSYANVVSSLALFVALGGTSYAVASLPKNSVGDRQLKSGAVSGSKLKDDAVTTSKIKDGSVTAADLSLDAAVSGPRGPRGEAGPTGPAGATGPAGPGAEAAEPWRALNFVDGWTNWGVFQSGEYRKDQLGIVHLRGLVMRAGASPYRDGPIATLPAGYRPLRKRLFNVNTGSSVPGRIDINPDGAIVWFEGGAGVPNYTSLDGVSFSTD